MSYEPELSIALEAAHEAGAILRRHYEQGTEAWEKSADNPVTSPLRILLQHPQH